MENSKEKKATYLKIIKTLALIGIILIPTIYTTIFLGSMWDPYGNISDLPVAIVNLDKEVNFNGKSMAVGNELVKNLKENNSLDFSFLNVEEAQEGLDDGSYYMVITIPEDFSSNATTLLEENPKKMELNYKTNPGKNYIASKMSESAIKQIASSIENSVTETYAKSVFDEFESIGVSLETAADGASQINEGLISLKDGTGKVSSNLKLLYDSSLTFTDGITTYENGIKKYIAGVEKVTGGAETLNNGMNTLNSKVSSLADGASALNNGSQSLYSGLQSYSNGVTSIENGAKLINSNSNKLVDGSKSLESNLGNLETGSKQMLSGLNTMSDTIGNSVNEDNSKNINTLTTSLNSVNKGINDLNTAMQNGSSNNLTTSFTSLGGNLKNIGGSVQASYTAVGQINSKIEEIKTASWFTALDSATQASIISDLSTPIQTLSTELGKVSTEVGSASSNLSSAITDATNISNQVELVKNSVSTLATNSNILLPKSSATITSLYSGLENVKTNLDNKLIPGLEASTSGVTALKTGSESLASGIKDYTDGVKTISDGASELNSNSPIILNGAKDLSDGIGTLSSSVPTLTSGVSALASGSQTLSDGLNELSSNNSTLTSGISTINSASASISDGVSKLYDGSLQISEGANKLEDGSMTLADKLKDGAESAQSTKLSDASKEMFASPVESIESFNSTIENNGSAMSAYMMCVGLWVGCLALCILFSTDKDLENGKENLKAFWPKKVLKLAAIATVQAIVMLTAIIKINGLNPAYIGKTYLFAVVTALSFMAIVYFMNLLLGKVGSFILLIFMMLQLSGSAGTYPIELSGKFFNVIHKYVPFTYAVDGFRNGLSTGESIVPQITVLAIIGIVCALISVFVVIKKSKSTRTSLSELIEQAM